MRQRKYLMMMTKFWAMIKKCQILMPTNLAWILCQKVDKICLKSISHCLVWYYWGKLRACLKLKKMDSENRLKNQLPSMMRSFTCKWNLARIKKANIKYKHIPIGLKTLMYNN